jgi:sialate O-acetylesterase
MVLQRHSKVPIWGSAAPGEQITVEFAGQSKSGAADANGNWLINLDPMPARSIATDLIVRGIGTTTLSDVLVGEVWIAAGQSNMEWPLRSSDHAAFELAKAHRPQLRLLNRAFAGQYVYGRAFDDAILARLGTKNYYSGTWRLSSPETASSFSAIAYSFGRILQERLDVPVGIVSKLGWPGASADAAQPFRACFAVTGWRTRCSTLGAGNVGMRIWVPRSGKGVHSRVTTSVQTILSSPAFSSMRVSPHWFPWRSEA